MVSHKRCMYFFEAMDFFCDFCAHGTSIGQAEAWPRV